MRWLWRFLRDESGPTAVEYAVMLVLIVVVCLSTIGLVGQWARDSFDTTSTKIQQASGS